MSPENIIYSTALGAGIPSRLAELMVAQAKHETGNFTSNFFRNFNNAFGYSYVKGAKWQLPDPGTLADNNAPIAKYSSVANSTMEIVDWIKRRQREGKFPANLSEVTSPEQYAQLLKAANYYQDTLANYSRGLVSFFKAGFEKMKAEGGLPIVGIIALGGIIYYIASDK